jgi:hypothetical protein
LPDAHGRRRAVAAALAAVALIVSIIPAMSVSAASPPGLERFLYALGEVESGGNYTARNSTSGAYGKYQILPSSWAAWAKLYLGSSTAPQTPTNQEIVAHRKVTALYNWLDTWPVVAHWWLTGSSERNSALWSSFSRSYVQKIMTIMASAPDVAGSGIELPEIRVADNSTAIDYRSTWSTARYRGYSGTRATYATQRGASASITFSGTSVAWYGPVGPTRGTARIYIDRRAVATVDLRRSIYAPHKLLFARTLAPGKHTFRIVVTSNDRPVAIDDLVLGR